MVNILRELEAKYYGLFRQSPSCKAFLEEFLSDIFQKIDQNVHYKHLPGRT